MRALWVSGTTISQWPGVEVWQEDDRGFRNITSTWDWSRDVHPHYEVFQILGSASPGAYWVPASKNPPMSWGRRRIVGTEPRGDNPVDPSDAEYRPARTYIWIPQRNINFQCMTNNVVCEFPRHYPPVDPRDDRSRSQAGPKPRHPLIARVMKDDPPTPGPTPPPAGTFQDSDGLISFVNLASDFVTNSEEFRTGEEVCDKVANFFATLRVNVFLALQDGTVDPLPDDEIPQTQWDPSVTHYMQNMLAQAGGISAFAITVEQYSYTQYLAEFSTEFVQLLFDAAVVPEKVISDVSKFLQNVGDSLRNSWEDKQKSFQTAVLGQCHEAVQEDASGQHFRYFPKIKYLHISIDSSQTEFSTPCADAKYITFNFTYENYTTALAAAVLDKTSRLYTQFVTDFLDDAQGINFKAAKNNLKSIMKKTASKKPGSGTTGSAMRDVDGLNVDLASYPLVRVEAPRTGRRRDLEARINVKP